MKGRDGTYTPSSGVGGGVGDGATADVVVVGAGPAGSTLAGLLARAGWDVLLLDRSSFPRPKACGECLSPGAVETLRRLGLAPAVEALRPRALRGWEIRTGEGSAGDGTFGASVEPAWALPRRELDAALLESARRRGVRIRCGVTVTGVTVPSGSGASGHPRLSVRSDDGPGTLAAPVVVGADGLRSVVARATGAIRRTPRLRKVSLTFHVVPGPRDPVDPLDGRGRLHLSSGGTVGVAPLGGPDRVWNVTVVRPSDAAGPHPGRAPGQLLRWALSRAVPEWDPAAAAIRGGPWASGPFDWPSTPVPAPGVVLVGDAAGYYDPLTGQGIGRALMSAELAAPVVDAALRRGSTDREALEPYARLFRSRFRPGRRVQRTVEAVVSRGWLRGPVVDRLGRASALLDALLRVTGDARPVRSLLRPRHLASLLRTLP